MYSACLWRLSLLAMMRYAAYLSFETPRPYQGQFGKQVSGTPFLTVFSSSLIQCRPWWEDLMLIARRA
jgi:hypothetical protein